MIESAKGNGAVLSEQDPIEPRTCSSRGLRKVPVSKRTAPCSSYPVQIGSEILITSAVSAALPGGASYVH